MGMSGKIWFNLLKKLIVKELSKLSFKASDFWFSLRNMAIKPGLFKFIIIFL